MSEHLESATRYKSVVFDFDFTLADPSVGVIECVNYALGQMALPLQSAEAVRAMIGVSLAETFAKFAGDRDHGRFAEFERLFSERGDQVMVDGVRLFDSTEPTVAALLSGGMSLGIVSTKYRRRIEAVLQRDGLAHAFAVIVGGDDVEASKPDPSGLMWALGKLGRAPAEVLYVGDSTVDAETTRRAGVPFVAVLSGVTSREALAPYGPRAIIPDLAILPELLL